jgi:hypothetical protein
MFVPMIACYIGENTRMIVLVDFAKLLGGKNPL